MIKYKISFSNLSDIRMGSHYNSCDLKVEGGFVPDISGETFQDLAAITADCTICYLVQWNSIKNNPGFKVWRLDGNAKTFSVSSRFDGICSEISANGDREVSFVIRKYDELSRSMHSEHKTYRFD